MAQTIKLKRSAVANRIPSISDLDLGEVAINTTDGKMYMKKSVSGVESIVEVTATQVPTDPTFNSLTLTGAPGPIEWNPDEDTVDVPLNDDVTLQLGQETLFRGKAIEAISNGDAVMFAGAQGDHLLVAKADMSSIGFAPEHVIGIATQDFAQNEFGFVTTFGRVRGVNTAALNEGDILYVDPSTAGALTTTKPTPPDHIIQMCAVTRSHLEEGTFLVRPTHFSDTDEVPEGASNLYFTDARAVSAVAAADQYVKNTGDTVTGNVTLDSSADLIFRDKNGTFPTNSGKFVWDLNNDSAAIYAQQPSSDQIDFFFKITDNAASTDRFVFWIDDYRGAPYDKYPAQLDGSGVYLSVPVSASGVKDLANSRMKIPYSGNPSIDNNTIWHAGNFNPNNYLLTSNYVDDYVTSAAFNTTNGVLTLTRAEGGTVTVDLDGRYLQTESDNQTLSWNGTNGQLSISGGNTVDLDGRYLTSYTETDTLATVCARGNTTNSHIYIEGGNSLIFDSQGQGLGGDVALRANGEAFEIYEKEDANKLWLRIEDDPAGNNSALKVNSTIGMATVWHAGNFNPNSYLRTSDYEDTTYNVSAVDVSGGKAVRLTGSDGTTDDVKFTGGSNVTLTRSGDTITIASTDTDTNTWRPIDDTPADGATTTSISSNWAFDNVKTPVPANAVFTDTNTETTTTLTKVGNELRYVNEVGTTQAIDLSLYLDDTNAAYIESGVVASNGIATFTRDDDTTFTVDMSVLLDDTNLSRITSASWNTSNGVLTLTRNDSSTVAVDLDGRYYNTTDSNNRYVAKAGDTMTGDLTLGSNRLNLKTGGSSTVPQLLGHRSSVDLDSRLFLNEGGFSYTTFDSGTPNRPGGVSNNANGVLTLNTHNGGYNHQLVFTNQGHIYHRSKESSTLRSWDRVFTDSYHPISWNELSDKPSIDNSVDYINAASFNTGTGVLTLSGVGRAGATVDLDNRYLTSYSETDTLQSVTARGNTTDRTISIQNSNPVLILKDVDSTGSSQLGYISLKDSSDVEKGWMGYGSGANTDLTIKNSLGKVRLDATYTYIPGLDLAISSTNSDHGKGTYFRGSNTHFVLGLQAGNTLYLNYGNESGALRLYGNTYYNNSLMLNSSRDLLSLRNATFSGTVTASAFSGNLDYNDITNPPVIDNSVDYINSASFNTSTGVLTLSGVGRAGATIDLDGRYLRSETDSQTLSWNGSNGQLSISNGNTVDLDGRYAQSSSLGNYMPIQNSTPYTIPTATTWGSYNLGNGTMMQASGTGKPSGSTHGYWYVIGKRDTAGGYAGLYVNSYQDAGRGLWIGRNDVGTDAPNWERVYTDDYHPISWNEITDKPSIDNSVDYINAASFNTSTGVLTLSGVGRAGATVDLDNRYQLDSTPAAPSITSTTVVGETIEVVFSQSSSSGIDRYEVWSNAAGSSYGLIAIITPEDFAASMSVVDSSFNTAGTVSYRVYAIRNGIASTAATTSQAFTAPTLEVTNMIMLPQLNTYILEYDLPESRFLDHIEIYVDTHETAASISRSNATLAYSGNRDAFTYNIASSDMNKFHQFWVECAL